MNGMRSTSRGAVVLTAVAVGALQVVGSFGAANNQPDRKAIDVLAVVLLLVGPAALAVRDRIRGGTTDLAMGRAVATALVYTSIAAVTCLVLVARRDVTS